MHTTQIKVRGYHLDLYGHVNNARYLEFLEEARWSCLETAVDLGELQRRGIGLVVVRIAIDYRRPVGLGTVLRIESRMTRLGGKVGVMHQDVCNEATGELAAAADVTFMVIDLAHGKAVAIAGEIREHFAALMDPEEQTASEPSRDPEPSTDPDRPADA